VGELSRNLQFFRAIWVRNLKARFALRGAFWLSASFMLLNNLLFFSIWWILMDRFEHVRGWRLPDVMCLYGLATAGFGGAVILAGGLRDLSRRISDGELDTFLTQPKSVLLQALACRTDPSGWGDVATGVILLSLSGSLDVGSLPLVLVGVTASTLTFIASAVVLHSLAFWWGRTESLSRALWDFTILFSVYPPSLFGPGLRVLLFTLLPAGFASYLPVALLRDPGWGTLTATVLGSLTYAAFAVWMFGRGLARYASGSRFHVLD
jgi:ABC-2 type transport system permease protein